MNTSDKYDAMELIEDQLGGPVKVKVGEIHDVPTFVTVENEEIYKIVSSLEEDREVQTMFVPHEYNSSPVLLIAL